ncbi:hypothetical protein JCM6882_004046 [Rhodosporidiobolus microsporus]
MVVGLRNKQPALSATTQLVHQLQGFGKDEPGFEPDLDAEEETLAVGGVRAQSQGAHKHKKGKAEGGTGAADANAAAEQLGKLSVKEGGGAAAGSKDGDKGKKAAKSLRNLLRSTDHTVAVQGADGKDVKRVLTSWKMADYAYKREPCPFPTRARGLFTEKVAGDKVGEQEDYRIVARGYDKFFNIGEVSWTHWDTIPTYSTGPYELTTKSNGCIILIGALDEKHIVVTSKHSIGKNANLTTEGGVSHSQRGEYWLEQHVEKVGNTKEGLAKALFERNLTAVAELCDDSFEEHVLAYPPELTGLHLHGLNVNAPVLNTLSSTEVAAFAKEWGMIATSFTTFPSVPAVKTYCDNVREAGGVEGPDGKLIPVEGFVVRGHRKGGAPGEAFFWKVKYDEPYLMYREWRELTRKLLSAYPNLDTVTLNKVRNEESRLYVWWVKREMEKDHESFAPWKHGKGIIRTREAFLEWCKTPEATKTRRELGLKMEQDEEERKNRKFDKTLVVPVAIQGCGKTAIGLELSHLFDWGHIQSDDFLQKKPAPHFLKAVKEQLNKKDVVYADKNNHVGKHRSDLVSLAESFSPAHNVRLVALVWPTNTDTLPRDKFHALCSSRIVIRGENHQTLRAGEHHEQIIWQFLGQHEPFEPATNGGDGKFDHVIEMRAEWSQEEALKHAVEELAKIDGVLPAGTEVPVSQSKLDEAVKHAKGWKTDIKKDMPTPPQKKGAAKGADGARYYGIAVDVDLKKLVEEHLPQKDKDDKSSLFNALVKSSRVEKHPHVTLVHRTELQSEDEHFRAQKQALWDRYAGLVDQAAQAASSPGEAKDVAAAKAKLDVELVLGPRLLWDERVMSLEVSALVCKTPPAKEGDAPLIELANGRGAHITIGTKASDIRPVEGKLIAEAFARGEKETKEGGKIHVLEMKGETRVPGKLAGLS